MKGGLRARILAGLFVAIIVPTTLAGVLAVRRARRDVKAEVVRGNLAAVRGLGAGLDARLQDTRRALSLAAATWATLLPPAAADPGARDPAAELARRLPRELPLVRRAAFYDADGRLLAGEELGLPRLERANTYGGYVGDVVRAPGGDARAHVVVQARRAWGELAGFLVAEIDLGFVAEALAAVRLSPGARLWVVDAAGAPVGWSGRGAAAGPGPGAEVTRRALAAAGEGSVEDDRTLAVHASLASFQTVRGVSWAIVLEEPSREAYALARATTRDTIVAGAIVLALALALGWVLAARLSRPLVSLAARVDAMAEGTPGASAPPLPTEAPGEIGALARRFDEMSRRVAERERLKEALARGQQLANVGALAAGVAHEINNPMTTILGYANLLLEDKAEDHRDREALALVADEARRVQGIVRTLLDHARAETGPPRREQLDVNALVERTLALAAPTLKRRGLAVKTELADDVPRPQGDPRRVEQVLVNLAQNAAQAMEHGGTLTLRTGGRGARAVVEVIDTGPGIAPELLGKIFEPFFTTKGPGVGTGLGLAIARQIVLDLGGEIEVDSRAGVGSTFRVIL